MRSATPMAIGVVTLVGGERHQRFAATAEQGADAPGRQRRGQRAGDERDQQRAGHRLEPWPLRVERDRERDSGRAEQEVHELCAIEIALVGRAGGEQQARKDGHADQHRVGERMEADALVDPERRLVGEQG